MRTFIQKINDELATVDYRSIVNESILSKISVMDESLFTGKLMKDLYVLLRLFQNTNSKGKITRLIGYVNMKSELYYAGIDFEIIVPQNIINPNKTIDLLINIRIDSQGNVYLTDYKIYNILCINILLGIDNTNVNAYSVDSILNLIGILNQSGFNVYTMIDTICNLIDLRQAKFENYYIGLNIHKSVVLSDEGKGYYIGKLISPNYIELNSTGSIIKIGGDNL